MGCLDSIVALTCAIFYRRILLDIHVDVALTLVDLFGHCSEHYSTAAVV